jgi:PAS domain S-box-containing protein
MCDMIGFPLEELAGQSTRMIYPSQDEFERIAREKYGQIGDEGPGTIETRWRRKDGLVIDVLLSSTPINPDDIGAGVTFAALDITERKRTTEDLRRSNQDLEQFAYVVSHDLQEPLRVVTGFTKLLQDHYKGKLDQDADQYLHYMVDGSFRMSHLITDLLAYARVNTGGRNPSVVSCQAVLDKAMANLGTAISESGARVTHAPLPDLLVDESQIVQLFQNLIGNAVKFRREGVAPTIHVGARREGEQWVLWVGDNGIGIPPEQFGRVFAIFQRLHGRETYPGTGIGLAICKKIVERHSGRIWVESKEGEGTTFYFSLPASNGTGE